MEIRIQEELESTFAEGTEVKKREGKYDYVEIRPVVQRLNDVLGYDGWSFVISERFESEKTVIVFGDLTVYREDGTPVVKMQSGRKKIAYKKNSDDLLDIGNDWKAAISDCLKKCASLIGVGLYLSENDYRNDDSGSRGQKGNPPPPPPPPPPNQPDDNTEKESPQGDGASSDIMTKRKEVHNVEKQVLAMHGGTRNKLRQSLLDGSINLPPTMEDLATYQITLEKMLTDGKDA